MSSGITKVNNIKKKVDTVIAGPPNKKIKKNVILLIPLISFIY